MGFLSAETHQKVSHPKIQNGSSFVIGPTVPAQLNSSFFSNPKMIIQQNMTLLLKRHYLQPKRSDSADSRVANTHTHTQTERLL